MGSDRGTPFADIRTPFLINNICLFLIQSTLAITDDQNLELFVRYSKGSDIRNIT